MIYDLNEFYKVYNYEDVIIFGAGRYGKYLHERIVAQGIRVLGFCDNKIKKESNIYLLDSIIKSSTCLYFVVGVVDPKSKCEIVEQLLNSGVDKEKIVIPLQIYGEPFFDDSILYSDCFREHLFEMQWEYAKEHNRIKKYFESNGLCKIGVFGEMRWIEKVIEELGGNRTRVIESINSKVFGIDSIVVIDINNYFEIEEKMMEKYDCPIIDMWRVLIA